jgi:hypothetical protein
VLIVTRAAPGNSHELSQIVHGRIRSWKKRQQSVHIRASVQLFEPSLDPRRSRHIPSSGFERRRADNAG